MFNAAMRLRLYHHPDGARVAYREVGTGPALVLLHSLGLSYREWEPVVAPLSARFRVVLPDLPLHGDSEDRPRHPYTPRWLTDVVAGFCREVGGPRTMLAGHDFGAELALLAAWQGQIEPARLVLMGTRLHRREEFGGKRAAWRAGLPRGGDARARPAPGLRRHRGVPPRRRRAPLGRGRAGRARPAPPCLRRRRRQRQPCPLVGEVRPPLASGSRSAICSMPIRAIHMPVLLLWGTEDRAHPLLAAHEALDLIPQAQLRTLPGTGFLMAYDDPVGVARELIAFCG